MGKSSSVVSRHRSSALSFLLRYPILLGVGICILLELILYILVRWIVFLWEYATKRHRAVHNELRRSNTFAEWLAAARKMDELEKNTQRDVISDQFEEHTVEELSKQIKSGIELCKGNKCQQLIQSLEAACVPDLGGVDEGLYARNYVGQNPKVTEFVNTVIRGIDSLRQSGLEESEKKRVFGQMEHSYGRIALCLSGGASQGYYHLGVVKALLDKGYLPNIISGSSAGSLVGAMVCVRTNEELKQVLLPEKMGEMFTPCELGVRAWISCLLKNGHIFDLDHWIPLLKRVTKGNTTFLEAYQKTGRILNISVFTGANRSRLLNYKSTPNVVIFSAVLASSAVPWLLPPIELLLKENDGKLRPYHSIGRCFRDGSFHDDLPLKKLHQQFNVNYTIVSQVEPHVVPFVFNTRGSAGVPTYHRSGAGWRGGFLISYAEHLLKLDMKKWLALLRDFDLLPAVFGTDWSYIFLQTTKGWVTIAPEFNLLDYPRLLMDPGAAGMARYMQRGQQATWPKLGMIEDHMRIRIALASCKIE